MGIKKLLKKILRFTKKSKNYPPFLIESKNNITCGRNTYHNGNFLIKGKNDKVNIGSFCAFGQDIKIITSNHNYNYLSIQYSLYNKIFKEKPYDNKTKENFVEIGSDVWIGDNVIILPNVKIGSGSIIAAGSIVTKSFEPYSIIGGVPAKFIKHRFDSNTRKELLSLNWWNWSDEKIKQNKSLFFKDFNKK